LSGARGHSAIAAGLLGPTVAPADAATFRKLVDATVFHWLAPVDGGMGVETLAEMIDAMFARGAGQPLDVVLGQALRFTDADTVLLSVPLGRDATEIHAACGVARRPAIITPLGGAERIRTLSVTKLQNRRAFSAAEVEAVSGFACQHVPASRATRPAARGGP